MKTVLIVGSGGRCHALAEALSRSSEVSKIYVAPGNAGIAGKAECVPISETDIAALQSFAIAHAVNLTVVGPETALAAGIADAFTAAGLPVFAPNKAAARIETSKEFAKALMQKYDIPTATYRLFDDYDTAFNYCLTLPVPVVIKYDGLAAGKGVVVARTREEVDSALIAMLKEKRFGHGRALIEKFLCGEEFSFMCLVNGRNVYPLALAQDHKRAFDGDMGPNTGGMGAYSPVPFITDADHTFALKRIMQKTADAMVDEGCPFCGVLYGGLIKTADGIKVIEFNARFGDPETEVVLPRLTSDLFSILTDVIANRTPVITWDSRAALGIVMASKGYPGIYPKGFEIRQLHTLDATVYHMGTQRDGDRLLTGGGRVLFVTVLADTLAEAQAKALSEVRKIDCEQLFYRSDIGHAAIDNV